MKIRVGAHSDRSLSIGFELSYCPADVYEHSKIHIPWRIDFSISFLFWYAWLLFEGTGNKFKGTT